jgi:hypothetical protein
MKKGTKTQETVVVATVETTVVKQLGRKVDPTSVRQQRLAALEAKKASGVEIKKGRPVVEGSARQQRLAALEAKKAEGTLRKGRPVDENSARQQRLKEIEAKKASGVAVKRGRPAKVKSVGTDEAVETAAAEGNIG